jgi:sodium/hydrogen antiporter
MVETLWFLLIGLLLVTVALAGSVLKRLPLSTSILYLAVGFGLGHWGLGTLDALAHAALLERVTEVAVLISLFSAGLKLRAPLTFPIWRLPLRLAFGSLALTVALLAVVGVWGLGLPLGAAVLLGAILAPTDPVLASDVRVETAGDQDRLRFGLTGEAGLNDGAAFPFVMLGLGLLGLHGLGTAGWRWLTVDVLWATAAGLGVGTLLGRLVGRLVLYLRTHHREATGLDDMLALGLIALSYGAALLLHAYGFLAVFAAGLSLRRIEAKASGGATPPPDVEALAVTGKHEEVAVDPGKAPAYMAQAVLGFTEGLERIAEVVVLVLVGVLLASQPIPEEALWFVPLFFVVVRPATVLLVLLGSRTSASQRVLMAWFGIRGIGSLYYLFFAVAHGLSPALVDRLTPLVLAVIATSAVIHGVSVTPLMKLYARQQA